MADSVFYATEENSKFKYVFFFLSIVSLNYDLTLFLLF